MTSHDVRRLTFALIAVAIGLAEPYAEVAIKCRAPASEACVWGRAFLPLGRWVGLLVISPVMYGLMTGVAYLVRRGRS